MRWESSITTRNETNAIGAEKLDWFGDARPDALLTFLGSPF
jgi:hypothetical protein